MEITKLITTLELQTFMAEKEFMDSLIAKIFPQYDRVASFKIVNGRKLAFGIPNPDTYPDVEKLIQKFSEELYGIKTSLPVSSEETCFTCHLDSVLLGYVTVENLETRGKNPDIGEIYFEKVARGTGIPDYLLHVALTEAELQGNGQVSAYVPLGDAKATKFYRRNGFKPGNVYKKDNVWEHRRLLDNLPHLSTVRFFLPEKLL